MGGKEIVEMALLLLISGFKKGRVRLGEVVIQHCGSQQGSGYL